MRVCGGNENGPIKARFFVVLVAAAGIEPRTRLTASVLDLSQRMLG